MSTAARPTRRLPARVYWTRRLVLLAIVVLLGFVLTRWVTVRYVDSASTDAGAATAAAADGAAADDSGDATPAPARSDHAMSAAGIGATAGAVATSGPAVEPANGAGGAATTQPLFSAPVGPCDQAETTAFADAPESVVSGTGAVLQVRLRTTGDQACTLTLTGQLLVQVALEDEALWRLSDCPSALTTAATVLHPGWATVVDVTWSGRASNASCALETADAPPGRYQVQAALLSGEPGTSALEVVAEADSRSRR